MMQMPFYISIFKLKPKFFVWTFLACMVSILVGTTIWIYCFSENINISPYHLRLSEVKAIDKLSPDGQNILSKLYGPYKSFISNNKLRISSQIGTVSSPGFEYKNRAFRLNEGPYIRYDLWSNKEPDIVLMGSSVFFYGFNREFFFNRFKNTYLIDFNIHDHTPLISEAMFNQLKEKKLKIKPGTIVIYGINWWELNRNYIRRHDFMKNTFQKTSLSHKIEKRIQNMFKFEKWNVFFNKLVKMFFSFLNRSKIKGINLPGFESINLTQELKNSPEKLRSYTESLAVERDVKYDELWDMKKIKSLKNISNNIQKQGGKLILLKMPTSYQGQLEFKKYGEYFDRNIHDLANMLNATYYDFSKLSKMGINETHFILLGKTFDRDHLNLEGSKLFTDYLIKRLALDKIFN